MKPKHTIKEIAAMLDSDDEIPDSYNDLPSNPAYLDDSRFDHIYSLMINKTPKQQLPHSDTNTNQKQPPFEHIKFNWTKSKQENELAQENIKSSILTMTGGGPSQMGNLTLETLHQNKPEFKANTSSTEENPALANYLKQLKPVPRQNTPSLIGFPPLGQSQKGRPIVGKSYQYKPVEKENIFPILPAERHSQTGKPTVETLNLKTVVQKQTVLPAKEHSVTGKQTMTDDNQKLISKGFMTKRDIFLIKSIEGNCPIGTFIWFIQYLNSKSIQRKHTCCLVGDYRKEYVTPLWKLVNMTPLPFSNFKRNYYFKWVVN